MHLLMAVMLIAGALLNRAVNKYDYVLDSWAGETERHLVQVWGEPQDTLESDNDESVYIYSKTRKSITGKTQRCVNRFIIDKSDRIVGSHYYGDDCLRLYGDNYLS